MKKQLSMLCALGVFALNAGAQGWAKQNSNSSSNFDHINFTNSNKGWVFGDSSIGATWITGIIRTTADGGATWTSQNMGSPNFLILSSYFFNSSKGLAVGKFQTTGNGVVISTGDGGATWTADSTSFAERLYAVDFVDASTGWIVGRKGYIAKSVNAGVNWTVQTSGTNSDLFGVSFNGANSGHAVGALGTALYTYDGGMTWTLDTTGIPQEDFNAVYFITPAKGWAVGNNGKIIYTVDSGNTWVSQTTNTIVNLYDLSFIDEKWGWVCGRSGNILATDSGGTNWKVYPNTITGTNNDITSIHTIDQNTAYFCGDGGDIFKSTTPTFLSEKTSFNEHLSIYPNPVRNGGRIFLGNEGEIRSITIYSISGKLIKTEMINDGWITLRESELSSGLYLVMSEFNDGQKTSSRFIIE